MRLADPVAGPSADNLATALKALKPPFIVSIQDLQNSRFSGVIVCEANANDVKVAKALRRGGVPLEIKKIAADECRQGDNSAQADPHPELRLFGPAPRKTRAGTLIFVGRQKPPSE